MRGLYTLLFIVFSLTSKAQNPISPPGVYIADPSAKVWGDTLFIYGSLDKSCNYYCSKEHHMMYTTDMMEWHIKEGIFHSEGPNDEVEGSDKLLFAPDASRKNGNYYLYFCMPDRDFSEGYATAKSPFGPFKNGQKIDLGGFNEIDPAVFTDDDGQVYYLWGQFTLKMALMKPDMSGPDLSTIRDSVITEAEHFFHEGAYLTKRNDTYYLVYADMSRADQPTCIGYATSNTPFGPYKYGGVIIDNSFSNPGNWNNHGSMAQFKGQWYVFYHKSTHGCYTMRKACIEPIEFLKDGSIPEVPMTSQGAAPPFGKGDTIDAASACIILGNSRIIANGNNKEVLTDIQKKSKIAFKYVDFDQEISSIKLAVKAFEDGGIIVKADKPWGKTLGTIHVPPGQEADWEIVTSKIDTKGINGVKGVWLVFWGDGENIMEIDWLHFY